MKKKILMLAFHYPPFAGSSGVQRTLRFSQYLPRHDWLPVILSAHPRAYEKVSNDLLSEIPEEVETIRAFALDSARHLSIKGRHSQLLAIPDRWISWIIGAIPAGLRAIKRHKPELLWSTYPLATTHLIAYCLHKITNTPWIADFRDPMVEQDPKTGEWAPRNTLVRKTRLFIEKRAVMHTASIVFCTEGAKNICAARYPDANHNLWHVIPNGYDEETFQEAEKDLPSTAANEKITLLHSGLIYNTADRDPNHFFEALSQLKLEQAISSQRLRIVLRACGHEDEYKKIVAEKGIADIVEFKPPIAYSEAIKEMLQVDGLLIFQGYTSNPAIPAKLYEYLRAKRPILALADKNGDTAKFLTKLGMNHIAPLDNCPEIKAHITKLISSIDNGQTTIPEDNIINRYSREHTAQSLASVCNEALEIGKK